MITYIIYIFIYLISFAISFLVFGITKSPVENVTILSEGAMIATFGSALIAIASMLEQDKLERVKQNISILYSEIFETESWKRWPFLKRESTDKLLSEHKIERKLENPKIPFDVGTHEVNIHIPTVLENFFDLPVIHNWWKMFRYRKAFMTKTFRKDFKDKKEDKKQKKESNEEIYNSVMTFESLYDSWKSIVIFRGARFLKHFAIALIVSSIMMVLLIFKYPFLAGILL